MKKPTYKAKLLVLALTAACSNSAFAAGFQLNGQSATGLGRAFAGDAVIADNASVIGRNSAAMALFDSPELSAGIVMITTEPMIKDASIKLGSDNIPLPDVDIGGTTPVPNIYYVHPINEQIALGAGIYSHFGTTTEFPNDYLANLFGGKTELTSVNFGLNASYRLSEQLSLGAGLDIIQGSGDLQRFSPSPGLGGLGLNLEASGIAVGWNIGAVYELNENHRFGLSYRYSPEVKAEIDAGSKYLGRELTGDLILRIPDIIEFSGYHALNEQVAAHYSVQWIGWSSFDKLDTTHGVLLNEYHWQNGWHFSVGGTYAYNDQLTLRAGYMFDTSAQDQLKSISVPDSNRHWLSAGVSYALTPNSIFDFGLTYLIGSTVNVNESLDGLPVSINAKTRATAWLYGLQYTHKF